MGASAAGEAVPPSSARVLDSVDEAVAAFAAGRPIVVVDDEDRENEGDLIVAACHATPAVIGLMVRYGSGVICAPMVAADLERLRLPPMTVTNEDPKATAYTVSVDARRGCTTGISAADRSRTLRVLADATSGPGDLCRPGHVFPLRAVPGGALCRPGHTEAAVDFTLLAKLPPVAAICELVNDNGSMMRLPQLIRFARGHNFLIVSIADLIRHRLRRETHLDHVGPIRLPTRYGAFRAIGYRSTLAGDPTEVVVLVMGEVAAGEHILVHLHRECILGDVFGTALCPCGDRLATALARIATTGRGVALYLRIPSEPTRPHPITRPIACNTNRGSPADRLRGSGAAHQILAELGVRSVRLLNTDAADGAVLRDLGTTVDFATPSP